MACVCLLPAPAGSLVGLSAFGAPVLLQTVLPKLDRYSELLQVRVLPASSAQ